MTWWEAGLILLAGVGAGTINTIVGSGTLITFPTLLALGFPPVTANVSNTVGLVGGGLTGVWGYRRELDGLAPLVRRLVPLTVIGAVAGAVLLLHLPESVFESVVPVLVAAALVLVVLQPRITRAMRRRDESRVRDGGAAGLTPRRRTTLGAGVAATGVYGGYFGAAQGILLVGLLGTLLPLELQQVNAVKNVLSVCANVVASVMFVLFARDAIEWTVVALILGGSLVGGLLGARIGRRLSPTVLRSVIVVVGCVALVSLVTS